jgi:two-component system chemotaxis response regulator CheY
VKERFLVVHGAAPGRAHATMECAATPFHPFREPHHMRIMLVDDSKTMRNIQRNILAQLEPSAIEEAGDGQDALSKVAAFRPDLILLDWNLPRMDGVTFTRTIRRQGNRTPIIMVTTEAEKSRVIEAIRAGVNDYIIKPFTPDILTARVRETLARVSAA